MIVARIEIAIAAFFLAIGCAGPPLEALRMVYALLICAVIVRAGRFVGAIAMVATGIAGWLQHGQLRLTLLASATLLGIIAHVTRTHPQRASAIAAIGAVVGLALLFFG